MLSNQNTERAPRSLEFIIDLTDVDTSDDEDNIDIQHTSVKSKRLSMKKFTYRKKPSTGRLQIVRDGMADTMYFSLYSQVSKNLYLELMKKTERTYVGTSVNPYYGNALFAAKTFEAGEMICLYLGRHIPSIEADAIYEAGGCTDYMLDVTRGVVIDGARIGQGAAMSNHSCCPNAELQHDLLPGRERAPIGLLRALVRINIGDEIETDYKFWDPVLDGMPDLKDTSTYVPCKCLRANCRRVLRLVQ